MNAQYALHASRSLYTELANKYESLRFRGGVVPGYPDLSGSTLKNHLCFFPYSFNLLQEQHCVGGLTYLLRNAIFNNQNKYSLKFQKKIIILLPTIEIN